MRGGDEGKQIGGQRRERKGEILRRERRGQWIDAYDIDSHLYLPHNTSSL